MITAAEANMVAHRNKGIVFNIKDDVEQQLNTIDNGIRKISISGGYTMFYDGVLYSETRQILRNNGYVMTDVYHQSGKVKVYIGVNIQWD